MVCFSNTLIISSICATVKGLVLLEINQLELRRKLNRKGCQLKIHFYTLL